MKKCLVCDGEWIIEHPGNVWSYKKEMYVDYIEGFCHYCNEEMIVDKKEYMDKIDDEHDSNIIDVMTGESIVKHKFNLSI